MNFSPVSPGGMEIRFRDMMYMLGHQIIRNFCAQDDVQFLVTDWAEEGTLLEPGPNDPDPDPPPPPPPPQSAFV